MPDLDKLNFYSLSNYMKRSDKSGQATETVSGSSGAAASEIVEHGLGYIPQFDFYADVANDGTIWIGGEIVHEYTESSSSGGGAPANVHLECWCDETNLTLQLRNNTGGSVSGNREIYWLIYLDYGS